MKLRLSPKCTFLKGDFANQAIWQMHKKNKIKITWSGQNNLANYYTFITMAVLKGKLELRNQLRISRTRGLFLHSGFCFNCLFFCLFYYYTFNILPCFISLRCFQSSIELKGNKPITAVTKQKWGGGTFSFNTPNLTQLYPLQVI